MTNCPATSRDMSVSLLISVLNNQEGCFPDICILGDQLNPFLPPGDETHAGLVVDSRCEWLLEMKMKCNTPREEWAQSNKGEVKDKITSWVLSQKIDEMCSQ